MIAENKDQKVLPVFIFETQAVSESAIMSPAILSSHYTSAI
jgi:hypothetical protein